MRVTSKLRRIYGDPSTSVPATDTFVISAGNSISPFTQGVSGNQRLNITVDRLTFTGNFTAVVNGLPAGITASVTVFTSSIDIQLSYNGSTVAGTYPFTVAITGSGVTKNFSSSIVINP